MEQVLMQELREILSRCRQRGLRVYVIGAYGVRAYGYLLRQSFDLDLAVERPYLSGLLTVLREFGFAVQPIDVWFAAEKKVGDVEVAVHVAVDYILDLASAAQYPISIEQETWRQTGDLDFALPVFSLEGVLITKLLAMRDNDVVDIAAILADEHSQVDASRLYLRALEAELDDQVQSRLEELGLMVKEGEVEAIWLDRLGTLLVEEEKARMVERVKTLLNWFIRENVENLEFQ